MAAQNRIPPKVPEFFGKTPKAPFGVEELESQLEGPRRFGYYPDPDGQRGGGPLPLQRIEPEGESLLNAGALISHELVPGHHFQINLQRENTTLPKFRRESGYTAFTEGWGDVCLGPGRADGDVRRPLRLVRPPGDGPFLTSRLVVDTGMIDLQLTSARRRSPRMKAEHPSVRRRDRHRDAAAIRATCPAQALAYKMGMRKAQSRCARGEEVPRREIRHPEVPRRRRSAAARSPGRPRAPHRLVHRAGSFPPAGRRKSEDNNLRSWRNWNLGAFERPSASGDGLFRSLLQPGAPSPRLPGEREEDSRRRAIFRRDGALEPAETPEELSRRSRACAAQRGNRSCPPAARSAPRRTRSR